VLFCLDRFEKAGFFPLLPNLYSNFSYWKEKSAIPSGITEINNICFGLHFY